jgi:hypothetical protein
MYKYFNNCLAMIICTKHMNNDWTDSVQNYLI